MVIPRICLSTRYILSELEEIEREDNFRLKRFKELKTKKKRKDSIDTSDIKKENKTLMHKKLAGLETKETDDISMEQEDGNKYKEKKMDETCSYYLNLPTEEHKKSIVSVEDPLPNNDFQDIMSHADEIVNLTKRNDSCDAKLLAINDELKAILNKLLMDRECEYCEMGTQVKDKKITHHIYHSDDNFAKSSALGSEISIPQSIFDMKSEDKEKLGHYKKKYKESVEVLRLQNEDGTIREKKKKVIVKTDTRNPIKAKFLEESAKQNLHCSCFKFDSESEDSIKDSINLQQKSFSNRNHNRFHAKGKNINNVHSNTKSEPACCNSYIKDAELRQCMSTDDTKRTSDSDTITCSCPSDNTMNLTVQSSSSDKLQNISINRLPFISSMYLNICNLHNNMYLDFTQLKNIYDNHNFHETSKGTLQNCFEKANQIVQKANFEEIGTCDLGLISINIVGENYRSSNAADNVEAAAYNILTKAVDISYMFKNIINAMNKENQNSVVHVKSCLQLSKFIYIFSKISEDKGFLENSSKIIDVLLTESYSYTSLYPCASYCYNHIDIESIINNACLHVVHFPYLFSQCISARSANGTTMRLDAEACHYPEDITVNLTFQGRNCGNCQSINITQLHSAPSVDFILFSLPWNIFQELKDVNYNCVNQNGEVQKKLRSYSQNTSTHLRMSKETTGTNTWNIDPTSTNENIFNKSYQALAKQENAAIQAIAVCASSDISDMNYIFNGTKENPTCNTVQKTTCLQLPEFAYIFSKISDVKNEAEDSSKTINTLFKGFYNNATKFPYIFSSYRRMEIETLLINACSYVLSFPYLFTNINNKKEENIQDDVKLTNIKILLSDDFKLTKCSYVVTEGPESSQIQISNNLIKIDNILEYESYGKKYLPCFSKKAEDKKPIELLKQESKNYNLVLNCSKSSLQLNTKCYFNHTTDEVCKNEEHNNLSYIFSKVKSSRSWNELNLSQHASIIESEFFINNNDKSVITSDVIFTISKGDHKKLQNQFSLQFVIENVDVRRYVISNFTYIFSKVSKSRTFIKQSNDLDIDVLYKDTCVHKYDFQYIFKKLDHIDFTKNLPADILHKEIDKLFKDYCKQNPIVNSVFKYILAKVELKHNNQDDFVYTCSKVKELPSNSDETKCLIGKGVRVKNSKHYFQKEVLRSHEEYDRNLNSHDFDKLDTNIYEKVNNINSNILKYGVNNDTTNFTYIFDKVLKGIPSMYDFNYNGIDVIFEDACKCLNEFPYNFNKTAQSSLYKEINKLFNDSCEIDIDLILKYDYLLHNRQIEKFDRNKNTKESIQQVSLSCSNFIDYSMKSPSTISNQSQRILVQLPRSKSGSSCSEFVLMLRKSYPSDKKLSLTRQSDTAKSLISSKSCCIVNLESTNDQYMIKSKSFHNQENVTEDIALNAAKEESMKDQQNISLIRQMLDTVKNVYVPLDTSITSQEITECSSKIDNLNSILSNSASSSYSWKSCVMKTCQGETENEEDISYSAFSFESSLDYVSYKSEDTDSDKNGCNGVVGNNTPVREKRILFDIETSLGSFVFNKDSCSSTKEKNPCTAQTQSNISYKCSCLPNMETKESSKILCGRVSSILDRSNHYYNLKQESSNSCCSYNFQFSKRVGEVWQPNDEYYCNITDIQQRKNSVETTADYSNAPTPCFSNSSVQNSQSLDLDKCCCYKKSQE